MKNYAKPKVWIVVQMAKDEDGAETSYFLNEIVCVCDSETSAELEAETLAKKGGTYSVFEFEVKRGIAIM